ncbi:hypothetical protein [Mycoplasma suis]|nr:hypothetical protein [Mycoplasma suis]
MNLTPKNESLSLYGKYKFESNFVLPNDFLEVSYNFPNQKVDRLFLKESKSDICHSSSPHLRCTVFENTAIIDFKKDSFFSQKIKNFLSTNFQINLKINPLFKNGKIISPRSFWWLNNSLNKQLIRNKLKKNFFNWKNVSSINVRNNSEKKQDLNILEEVTFQSGKKPFYSYYPLKVYSTNSEDLTFNLPSFYIQDVLKRGDIKSLPKESFSGKISFFNGNNINKPIYIHELKSEDFQLENFSNNYWRYKFTPTLFQNLKEKVKDFTRGSIDLNFEIERLNRKDSVNLTSNFFKSNKGKSEKNITFDPEGFKLDNSTFSQQWIKEEL